jgi:hypothetical protein
VFTVLLLAFTVTGLIPEDLPIIGPYSYSLKNGLQDFLQIGDEEFYSLFGSITGIFSLLFSIGFASSKLKAVSYYMINKDKIKKVLSKVHLSFTDKGRIISLENRIGLDLDGDKKIGSTPIDISESDTLNFISDVVGTFNELGTIMKIDKDTLREAVKENNKPQDIKDVERIVETVKEVVEIFSEKPSETNAVTATSNPAPEVVVKKPATAFRPNRF